MIQRLLPPNPSEAPRKKLRGLRRYFRRVFARATSYNLDVGHSAWYDFWHDHPDRYGYGNLNWRLRARHLEALARMFDRFAQQLKRFDRPYQVWIYLDTGDSSQDAVYVHSPNPNEDDFPVTIEGAAWEVRELSRYFAAMLPDCRLRAGRLEDSSGYFIYAPDIGLPLERPENLGL